MLTWQRSVVWKVIAVLTDAAPQSAAVTSIPRPPAPRSGLKILVDLGDVQHDALPVWPVRLYQLLHVLFGPERRANEKRLRVMWIRGVRTVISERYEQCTCQAMMKYIRYHLLF